MESLSRLPNSLETWTLPGSRSCPKYEKIRSFDRFLCTTSPYGNHLVQGTISKEFRVYLSDEKYSIGNLQKLAFEHPFPFAPPLSLQPCHSVQDQRRSRKSPPSFLSRHLRSHPFSMGPMLIGTVFNVLLYGIMITQVYLYFQSSSKSVSIPIRCSNSNLRAGIEFG